MLLEIDSKIDNITKYDKNTGITRNSKKGDSRIQSFTVYLLVLRTRWFLRPLSELHTSRGMRYLRIKRTKGVHETSSMN